MRQAGGPDDLAEPLGTFKFHTPIRIRIGETDANRHVNQVSYFIYIEQARTDYALVEPSGPRLEATARGNLVYFDHETGKSTPPRRRSARRSPGWRGSPLDAPAGW